MRSGPGLQTFSLVGSSTPTRRATRRERANAALIRHRQKAMPKPIQGASYEIWTKWITWQLEWENAIYRYRDGNNGKDDDND
jgi:hypothetical protein